MDHPQHSNRFLAISFLGLSRLLFWALGIPAGNHIIDEIVF
jgi:hypothetical protein